MQTSTAQTGNHQNGATKLTVALLFIYLLLLIWILLFKMGVQFSYMPTRGVNFIPFNRLFVAKAKVDKVEMILNLVIFIPLGIYAGLLFKKWPWYRKLLLFAALSLLLEGLQYLFRIGALDTTDIVTNSLGGLAGLLFVALIDRFFSTASRTQKFINVIASIATVMMITFLFLLKLNMLPIRYQ